MNNKLLKKMMSVSRLTSRGKLLEATAVIQKALAGALPASPVRAKPRAAAATVVDLEDAPAAKSREAARFEASSFTNAGGTRAFKLFEPAGFSTPLPLVVMLHGCTQNPDDFAAGTRMNALAQSRGFYVLYPEQGARSNAHRCWNWFAPGDQKRGAGEPSLIAGMTRHVIAAHDIDADRVFVAGLSAGGAMAAILAREYADVFAAAGVHSGLPAGAAHDVASAFGAMKSGAAAPVHGKAGGSQRASAPVIVFHGSADTTVAPANGDAVIASVLASAAPAVRTEHAVPAKAGRKAQRSVWSAAEAGPSMPSLAEQWVVAGSPHAWSGGAPAGSYTDAEGPDASAEMLRFFLEHPRRRAS